MRRDLAVTRSKRLAGGEERRHARPLGGYAAIVASLFMLLTPGPGSRALAGDKLVTSVSSRLVLVPVTVTDRNGKPAMDLEPKHFSVTEDSQPREITSLTREEAPVGLGLVVDLSGSMHNKLKHAVAATRAIADLVGPADEVFLMTFGDRPEMRVGFARGRGRIASGLLGAQAYGDTALIDAVYQALHEVRASSHRRRALVVISDGGDNASRYNEAELKRRALEADVQIYGISMVEGAADRNQRSGAYLLEELAAITGGLHFTIRNRADLTGTANKLARAMKDVYTISYKPGEGSPGKYAQDSHFGNGAHT